MSSLDNLLKSKSQKTKGSSLDNLLLKKKQETVMPIISKPGIKLIPGGGAYNTSPTNALINTGHTTYGGVPTKSGFERADIVPVSLGGSNQTKENITYEPYPTIEKLKDKFFKMLGKDYIPQTKTDKYLKDVILPDYKSGKINLNQARIKAVSYLNDEQMGLKKTTLSNIPGVITEGYENNFNILKDATIKTLKFFDPRQLVGYTKNSIEQAKQEILHPLKTSKETFDVAVSGFKEPLLNLEKKGEPIINMVKTGQGSVAERAAAELEYGAAAVSVAFSPITVAFAIAEKNPALKPLADLIALPFTFTGKVGSFTANKFVDELPISNKNKEILRPGFKEVGSLLGQVILGAKIMEVVFKKGPKEISQSPEVKTVSKIDELIKNQPQKIDLYRGDVTKPGEAVPVQVSFKKVAEFNNQVDALKELVKKGDKEAAKVLSEGKTAYDANFDQYLDAKFKSEGYDAIKYDNLDRPQIGVEYRDVNKGESLAVNEATAKAYSYGRTPTRITEVKSLDEANSFIEKQGKVLATAENDKYKLSVTSDNQIYITDKSNGNVAKEMTWQNDYEPNFKILETDWNKLSLEKKAKMELDYKIDKFYNDSSNANYYLNETKVNKETGVNEIQYNKPIDLKKKSSALSNLIEKKTESTKLQSRVYERLKSELPENLREDVNYTEMNMKKDVEKAIELVEKDKQKAYDIAMGKEKSTEVTSTAVNIALAEKALADGNFELYAKLVKNRSLDQTRRGQELNAEKGSVTDNSTSRYVKDLISARLDKLGKDFTVGLKDKKKSLKEKANMKIDKEVSNLEIKIKSKKVSVKTALDLLDRLTCLT